MPRRTDFSWRAFSIFFAVLLLVVTVLDWQNDILVWQQWSIQVGLIALGMLVLAAVGFQFPDLSAPRGAFLVFSIGILTLIPAVLLSLNPPGDFWSQYFTIGLSMAAGSFLGFLFIWLMDKRL